MPMIDVYATAGTFPDKHQLAVELAATLMGIEQVPTSRCSARTPPRSSTTCRPEGSPTSTATPTTCASRCSRTTTLGSRQATRGGPAVHRDHRQRGQRPGTHRAYLGPAHRGPRRRLGTQRTRQHQRRAGRRRAQSNARRLIHAPIDAGERLVRLVLWTNGGSRPLRRTGPVLLLLRSRSGVGDGCLVSFPSPSRGNVRDAA